MQRLPLSSLIGSSVTVSRPVGNWPDGTGVGEYIVLRNADGIIVAGVSVDDIFDANGNRFHRDV